MKQLTKNALTTLAVLVGAPLACHIATVRADKPATPPAVAAPAETLQDLAREAVTRNGDEAIAKLRAHERDGLLALLDVHDKAIAELVAKPQLAKKPESKRLRRAIDRVAGQRDAHLSGLYWHTNLDRAKEEARLTSRPILSLRMLGRLDEELSCANSRMFRTLLYPHAAVKKLLAESFVLHWSSERPVPRVDIDMRDGRKLTSTITGNSVHYVLDAGGNPIDAIPGLYGAAEFTRLLTRARDASDDCQLSRDAAACVKSFHTRELDALDARYAEKRAALSPLLQRGMPPAARDLWVPSGSPGLMRQLQAFDAGGLALGKGAIELPLLERMRPIAAPAIEGPVAWWERLIEVDADDFDEGVQSAMALKMETPDPSGGTRASLAMTVAADALRNEYVLHARIHGFFTSVDGTATSWHLLNRRIYDDVFLTPRSDPWLGLKNDEVYDALEG